MGPIPALHARRWTRIPRLPAPRPQTRVLGLHLFQSGEEHRRPLPLKACLRATEAALSAYGSSVPLDFGRAAAAALARTCQSLPASLAYVEARRPQRSSAYAPPIAPRLQQGK